VWGVSDGDEAYAAMCRLAPPEAREIGS